MKIQIPQPCQASWQEMKPEDKGRFCQQCQKVVIDFTNKSNREIISYLSQNPHTCGRFHSKQLYTTLRPEGNQTIKKWHTYLLGLMALVGIETLSARKVHAQQNRVIKGQIIDKELKIPVIGGSIYVKGNSKNGILTDANGKFKLTIPQDSTIVLVVTTPDHNTKEISVKEIPNSDWIYELEQDGLIGEVVIRKVPFYKKLWWAIKKPFIRKKKKKTT